MRTHLSRTVSRCLLAMRQLRRVRRSVPSDVFQSLIASLARLDYGYATLAGILAGLTTRLQSVLNAAARMIVGLRRRYHISQTLADLHWLRSAERIDFKLAVTVYRCLHNTAPRASHVTFAGYPTSPPDHVFDRRRRRCSPSHDADCSPLSAI